MEQWRKRWTAVDWTAFLAEQESPMDIGELRRSTHTGRPLGTADFLEWLGKSTRRPLEARRAGGRKMPVADTAQEGETIFACNLGDVRAFSVLPVQHSIVNFTITGGGD